MLNRIIRYFVIFLAASIALVTPDPAFALLCVVPPFEEAYERHDLLLHGKLVDRSTPLPVAETTTLVFETIKVYKGEHRDEFTVKGEHRDEFTVKADLSWDDHYREGEEYVLFADRRDDHYYRELCVGNYIATKGIVKFLDDYSEGKATDQDVSSLFDVVSDFEREELQSKMYLYSKINRGNDFLYNLINEKANYGYSCDFEADVGQAEKLFADDVYVFNKLRQNSSDYTITTDVTLSTNPQTGTVVVESQQHRAVISILNSPHFENCLFVYDQRLIDKATGELDVHRDNLEIMCSAENATAVLPDLCKPRQTADIANPATSLEPQGMLHVIVPLVIVGGIALVLVVYKMRKRNPSFR